MSPQAATPPIRMAVVGCGAFGRNHVRIYSDMPGVELAGLHDQNPETAAILGHDFHTRALSNLDDVIAHADAASVAVPTVAHAEVAIRLLEAGLDVLVEKPIAPSLEAADRMIAAARRHGRILMVGHLERFNPAVQLIRSRLTRPLFFEVHRLSVFTPRSLDVDVLLDLMIHDLDVVLSFVHSPIAELHAVGLAVLTPFVDIANVRLGFANGCVANLTASRVSTEKVRKLRFFQPGEYISLDYARRDARVFSVKTPVPNLAATAVTPEIVHDHLTAAPEAGEPLRAELAAFAHAIRTRQPPETDGPAARAALDVALRCAQAIARHAQSIGLPQKP